MESEQGFSILEVILAVAVFTIFATGFVAATLQGLDANRLGSEETIANQYAAEGMEAARSIKNQSFSNLLTPAVGSNNGITRNGSNVWAFSGSNNIFGKYTRSLTLDTVNRDAGGNIVPAPTGTLDLNTKKITSTVSWSVTSGRSDSVVLSTYLTNWKAQKGGMLVYGNGGTTTDGVQYQIFDANTNTWGTATTFDIDTSAANKALRAERMYSSSARNEKILLSRLYNGSTQTIFASVWNGSTWTSIQLSTWTATTFLDVLNFDGAYLSNGQFMAIYSDNTVIPKARVWDGTTWQTQTSLTTLGTSQIPNFIVASARPGTNEVMAAFFTQGNDMITQYWNGASWSAITTHATAAPTNTKRFVDFAWNPNTPTLGTLTYASASNSKTLSVKTVAISGGVGTWSTAGTSASQTNILGAVDIISRPTANEFLACDKDAGTTPTILCYKITSNQPSAPTVGTATTIASATDTGIQRSYDIDYKTVSGDIAVAVYSDNTAIPKFKKYTAGTSTWDSAATSISMTGFTPGVFKTIRIVPQDQGDDMIALMADANLDVYSVFWNGSANAMYITPAAKATTIHGTNGSATTDFWYDFAWDKN